jgi:MOSC domain-containing protein
MSPIGHVDSVWRYPVKSMRGQAMSEIFVGFAGVYGDRLFAFKSAMAPPGFPFFTGRERPDMLLYRPRFRYPEKAALPPNLAEAEALAPGLNPIGADASDLAVDIETPSGRVLAIDDPELLRELAEGAIDVGALDLLRSERAMTDCRPVSLFSLQTARQLSDELGMSLDTRRFRANVYLDLQGSAGFAEEGLVGRRLRIGSRLVVSVVERDPRCNMITLDPDSGAPNPDILRKVAQSHGGTAGVYGAVLAEGRVRAGDRVELLD